MGEQKVYQLTEKEQMNNFVRHLLRDVQAIEHMIENDWFETGIKRIGSEQEICLVDKYYKPAPVNMDILGEYAPDWITTELARFNLEVNMNPREFTGNCFSLMEAEVKGYIDELRIKAAKFDTDLLLTGIMPTIRKFDMNFDNLTPVPRYFALMDALKGLRGEDYELRLSGIDEMIMRHDSPLLEACNTSFQVHLQVEPSNFVQMYNIAQAITGPIIAISANSPLLFGKRLWHETRIALFQQSIDSRTSKEFMRDKSPRVTFGKEWLKDSILEIYKEDIVRFRVLLGSDIEEDAFECIKNGNIPKLKALQVHNSTVYRWNRPCYGIGGGVPHLRIENRVIPAGPTILDEMANAAFWLGLMEGMADHFVDITKHMDFSDARDNFMKASQTGIDSKFTWTNDKKITAVDLILNELLPIARHGLLKNNVDEADINRYLGVIEGRAKNHMTGARWMLRSYTKFRKETNQDEALTAITATMMKNQKKEIPVHEWEMPSLEDLENYAPARLKAQELMSTDLYTIHEDDVLELVADTMDWRKIRYLPVEDTQGRLIGLVTARLLLRHFTKKANLKSSDAQTVKDIMIKAPHMISPHTTIIDALELMRNNDIGCLPVVEDGKLLGLITAAHFLNLSLSILKKQKS